LASDSAGRDVFCEELVIAAGRALFIRSYSTFL
jgi:hypothetical protein